DRFEKCCFKYGFSDMDREKYTRSYHLQHHLIQNMDLKFLEKEFPGLLTDIHEQAGILEYLVDGFDIDFRPAQLFFAAMYLVTSSKEQGYPDFDFKEVPDGIRNSLKEWTQSPRIRPIVVNLCNMDYNSHIAFQSLMASMFKEYCFEKILNGGEISSESLDAATTMSKEIFEGKADQIKSVLSFVTQYADRNEIKKDRSLDLDPTFL
ncbi:MAG TPA: hypothetical protein VIY47_08215, partial [Ignavibacteriaceae bacterium]